MRPGPVLLACAAGLAIADASIVTLALPELLRTLHTSVEGVAAILAVYTAALAAALPVAVRLQRSLGAPAVAAGGLLLFAAASVVCGISGSLGPLLVARAAQAAGGAAALAGAFQLLRVDGADSVAGRRLWLAAAVLGAALGPALGGALTEALSWRAIFLVPVPLCALAAVAAAVWPAPADRVEQATPPSAPDGADDARRAAAAPAPMLALGLVSAALTAVLFLLVLLLVAGWDVSPLRAALTVTVLPAFALLGARIGGPAAARAAAGCALVGAGVLALAFLPDARPLWTVPPQAAAGLGMGLALRALAGELLPERNARDAARLLTARHVGITAALALLAPIVAADLDDATRNARLRGTAIVLDARLPPEEKVRLAPLLLVGVGSDEPRAELRRALREQRADVADDDLAAYDRMGERADETLVLAVGEAFRTAFLVTGGLAILAAAMTAALGGARLRAAAAAGAVAVALPAGYLGLHAALAPEPVELHDPCEERPLPRTGGIGGFLQDRTLELLDTAACRLGSSREQLVLALADDEERRRFEAEHGVDPRSVSGVLRALLG
jgi:predicted MFS family arabinose efflux permease